MTGDINVLACFAGIGGIELGLAMATDGSTAPLGYIERDRKAAAMLYANRGTLGCAPIWDDIRTFNTRGWSRHVDIVAGGYPCQGFSTATRGRPTQANLWPHLRRVIVGVQAPCVFLENVPRAPWHVVESDLAALGYTVRTAVFCPSELGAIHRRPRQFLLAYADGHGESYGPFNDEVARVQENAEPAAGAAAGPLGVDDGVPSRMDRLRALGNSVSPIVACHAFRTLHGAME